MSTKKIVLIVLGAIASLCLLATICGGIFFAFIYKATQAPVNATDTFFSAAKRGEFTDAYDNFVTDGFRAEVTRSEFKDYFDKVGIDQYESVSFSSREVKNDIATLNGNIKIDGNKRKLEVILKKVNGKWLVHNIDIE